jgi:hypothetical protein
MKQISQVSSPKLDTSYISSPEIYIDNLNGSFFQSFEVMIGHAIEASKGSMD